MGCGASKDEIALGNTVPSKSLQTTQNLSPNPPTKTSSEEKPSETRPESTALISKDSPDRYFSSRKDEEAIAGGNVLGGDDDRLILVDSSEEKFVVEVSGSEDGKRGAAGGKGSEETVAEKMN